MAGTLMSGIQHPVVACSCCRGQYQVYPVSNYLRQYVLVNASNLGPYSVSSAGVS